MTDPRLDGPTPGPWTIIPAQMYDGDDDDLVGGYTSPAGIEGASGDPVCVFGSADGSGALFENEADYHLIAAAPDGLEFAEWIAYHWENQDMNHADFRVEAFRRAEAFITRARGKDHA